MLNNKKSYMNSFIRKQNNENLPSRDLLQLIFEKNEKIKIII